MVKTYRKTKNTGVNLAARCLELLSNRTELRLNFGEAKLRLFPVNTCKYEGVSEEGLAKHAAFWTSREVFWIITQARRLHWSPAINKGLKIW